MRRRVVARKVIKKSVRAWVGEHAGPNLVNEYRKHYHASWSCAVIELSRIGVPLSAEDIEEATIRQIAAVESDMTRKARKAATRLAMQIEKESQTAAEAVNGDVPLVFDEAFHDLKVGDSWEADKFPDDQVCESAVRFMVTTESPNSIS